MEFTQSRPYRTTDHALVEGKNGAVIRKHSGYGALAAQRAEAWQRFYTAHCNPSLNYHRPCGFATVQLTERGQRKRRYPVNDYRTPHEKRLSLPHWEQYLKPGKRAGCPLALHPIPRCTNLSRKENTSFTQALPFSGSFLDWKMLWRRL